MSNEQPNEHIDVKNERERAWREMAQQIAHEIKNPLTPMKLSVQYLQRAIDEKNPNATILAGRVCRMLIEQIDHLSAIATAFSSFAKLPKPNNEYLDINQILIPIAELFQAENGIEIFVSSYQKEALVYADKNQLVSVFNNLVKNSVQSIPESRQGQIEIIVLEEYGEIKVVVMDNGCGIAPEQYEKIFVPNFTTKSSGTGLGLAISKQMVENNRGRIWFDSSINVGTTFYVTIPVAPVN